MNPISKPMLGLASAIAGGLAVFAVLEFTSLGREASPPARLNVQDAPINRDNRGVTSYAPIIKLAEPSVVNIYSTRTIRMHHMSNPFFNDPLFRQFFGDGGDSGRTTTRREQGLGSGVIVSDDGYVLTANHVVEGADPDGVKVALPNGKEFTAKVVGTDRPTDVAVLKVDAKDLPAIIIADSDKLEIGDIVFAIGNPFGVGRTVTAGIISALGRSTPFGRMNDYEDFIQTDAAINPGNSGGALVDAEGRLIGINTAIISESGGHEGVGFAVPANMARGVMEQLVKFGKVTRGFLGVGLQPEITPELQQEFKLPDQIGAMVSDVAPNTPAAAGGLKEGDVIREVNGKPVADGNQLRLMVSEMRPGTKVDLKVLHDGKEVNVSAKLAELPADRMGRNRNNAPEDESTPGNDALEGVEVQDIDANARQELSIPSYVKGALVANVDPDSTSADAGLREGDVILEINRKPVRNADDAVTLSQKAEGSRVLLRVWRNGGSFFLSVNSSKRKE